MIITRQRPFDRILKSLDAKEKVFIMGCGECATTCKTGGEPEVKQLAEYLRAHGKDVTGWVVPKAPCLATQVKIAIARNRAALNGAEAVISLGCGLSVQSIADNLPFDRPVIVGCDSLFMGQVDARGAFLERCAGCGECVLEYTAGICPVTRCAKGLLMGPCGGQRKGKCEVDPSQDCCWIAIHAKLKERGQLELLKNIKTFRDTPAPPKPRTLTVERA